MTYLDKLIHFQNKALSKIRLVAFDVDGVLTDGSLHYQQNGEATKIFSVRDGVGLKLLSDMGIHVAVVTAKDSQMVKSRMADLGIKYYYAGVKNKLDVITQLATELKLGLEECAFVGDDVVDLPAMMASGTSFCPYNAYPLVKEIADVVLDIDGGKGIARLVCDVLLVSQGKFEDAYKLASMPEFERYRNDDLK